MPKLWNRVKSGDVYGFGLRLGSSALQGLDCLCYCARTIKFDFVVSLGGSYEKAGSDNLLCNGREQRNGTGGWCIYWCRNGCRRRRSRNYGGRSSHRCGGGSGGCGGKLE